MITTAAAAAALAFGVLVFSFPSCAEEASARGLVPDDRAMTFETLEVRREGAVMFVDIAAPPMNLLGPELVRDLVALSNALKPTALSGCWFSGARTAITSSLTWM